MRKAAQQQFSIPQNDVLMDNFEDSAVAIAEQHAHSHDTEDVYLHDEVEFKIDVNRFDQESLVPSNDHLDDDYAHDEADVMGTTQIEIEADPKQEPMLDEEPQQKQEGGVSSGIEAPLNALPAEINHDVDLTALFYFPSSIDGDRLRQFLTGLVNLDKPILAYGWDTNGKWKQLTREEFATAFTKATFSLQLVDRAGAVSSETLQQFKQMTSEFAYSLSAQIEWVGAQNPLESAQALDAFCLEVDKTIGFHIVNGSSGRFTGTKFRGLAEAHGLVLKDDGAFYAQSERGQTLFRIINVENNPFNPEMLRTVSLKGLTFQMDIALAEHCTETFNRMVTMAKSMALSLTANLVDDHQRELTDVHIEKIRQQLKLIQVQMTVKGIVPGSQLALRLFS